MLTSGCSLLARRKPGMTRDDLFNVNAGALGVSSGQNQ